MFKMTGISGLTRRGRSHDELDGCRDKPFGKHFSTYGGKPPEEEGFRGAPQRHPRKDDQAFADNARDAAHCELRDGFRCKHQRRNNKQRKHKSAQALLRDSTEIINRAGLFLREMRMGGGGNFRRPRKIIFRHLEDDLKAGSPW